MTDPTPEPNAAALARYLSGESGPAEAEAIRRWIEADPERRRGLEDVKAAWSAAAEQSGGWDLDAMWSRIAAQMTRPPAPPVLQVEREVDAPRRRDVKAWSLFRWGAIAATVVFVSGAAIWQLRHQPPAPMRDSVLRNRHRGARRRRIRQSGGAASGLIRGRAPPHPRRSRAGRAGGETQGDAERRCRRVLGVDEWSTRVPRRGARRCGAGARALVRDRDRPGRLVHHFGPLHRLVQKPIRGRSARRRRSVARPRLPASRRHRAARA